MEILESALMSGLISALIAAFVAFYVTNKTIEKNDRTAFQSEVIKLIEIGIQYPHFECEEFTTKWDPKSENPENWRYDLYCCAVFNLLERAWDLNGGNRKKLEKLINCEELIRRHRKWFYHPVNLKDNIESYKETGLLTLIDKAYGKKVTEKG